MSDSKRLDPDTLRHNLKRAGSALATAEEIDKVKDHVADLETVLEHVSQQASDDAYALHGYTVFTGPCAHGRDPWDRCDECGEETAINALLKVRAKLEEHISGLEKSLENARKERDETLALAERRKQDRDDALSATTTEGLSASEWQLRTGKAERERDEAVREVDRLSRDGGAALLRVMDERDRALARCAALSAAGQALSEHVDKPAGAPLGSFEVARNALGGEWATLPNKARADTIAKDDKTQTYDPRAVWGEADTLTLRDEFAKAAMQGMLSCGLDAPHAAIVSAAYAVADRMLAERGKP